MILALVALPAWRPLPHSSSALMPCVGPPGGGCRCPRGPRRLALDRPGPVSPRGRLACRGCPRTALPGDHEPAVPGCLRFRSGFLRRESGATSADTEEGFLFGNAPEAVFTACLLGFLSTMTLVTLSQHFGLLWVSIEATTLVSAPLIHYHRHHRSLEATWKYLLVCSVGIAVALLGTYFLAASVSRAAAGIDAPLTARRSAGRSNCLREPGRRVAESGIPPAPCGIRHENGSCAHAHVASRRTQRSALGRLRAALRRAAQLRVPGRAPHLVGVRRRRSRRVRPADHPGLRPGLHGGGRRAHHRPAGLQAHARVLQRGAHGHPLRGHRARRPRRLGRAVPRGQPFPHKGRAVSPGGQLPRRLRHEEDLRCERRASHPPGDGGPVGRGASSPFSAPRLSACFRASSRSCGPPWSGLLGGRRGLLPAPCGRVRRDDQRARAHGAGRPSAAQERISRAVPRSLAAAALAFLRSPAGPGRFRSGLPGPGAGAPYAPGGIAWRQSLLRRAFPSQRRGVACCTIPVLPIAALPAP